MQSSKFDNFGDLMYYSYMQYIPRSYDNLGAYLEPGKVLVLFGPRQTGKTTIIKHFLESQNYKYRFVTGDDLSIQQALGTNNLEQLKTFAGGFNLLIIDEAQNIPGIGIALKLLTDNVQNLKIIATGSSSFELADQVGEPLTGRKRTLHLYPISQLEVLKNENSFDVSQKLGEYLVYGGYPAVLTAQSQEGKRRLLEEYLNSYALKDILALEKVKGSAVLMDLLRLLAFQIGGEVSHSELGRQLNLDNKTVARYLDLLEKGFVIFNLRGYSGNLRKEVTKKSKYYFYDVGIRNAVIANFNPLPARNDIGQLWENFLAAERLKTQEYKSIYANNYFWRTWDKKEVNWLEEREGKLFGFEFKFSSEKNGNFKDFSRHYPEAILEVVNKENYQRFLK